MGICTIGIQRQYILVTLCGLLEASVLVIRIAQIKVRLQQIRLKLDGSLIADNRIIEPARFAVHVPQAAIIKRGVRLRPDRLLDQIQRRCMISFLMGNTTQQVQRIGVLGGVFENVFVNRFGPRQIAGLMAGDGLFYLGCHGCFSHAGFDPVLCFWLQG